MNPMFAICCLALAAAALTSCSDSDDANDSDTGNVSGGGASVSGEVTQIGFIEFGNSTFDDSVDMLAFFIGTDRPVSAADVVEAVSGPAPITEDQCEIAINPPEEDDEGLPGTGAEVTVTPLSAGEVITVSSPAGSYAELRRSVIPGTPQYLGPQDLPAPAPAGLSIDIPGDQFAAFGDVAMPEVALFVLNSPQSLSEAAITANINWVAGSDPSVPIVLYTDLTTNSSTMTDTGGTEEQERSVVIDCLLVDDGQFSFDQATQTQLSEAGFDTLPLNMGREAGRVVQQGDALLFLTQSSGDL